MTHGLALPAFIGLMVVATLVALLGQRFRLPYAIALVLAGLGLGFTKLFVGIRLDPHTLFTALLPPLLFEAAIHLGSEDLKRDWKPIVGLALGGTLLAMAVTTAGVHWGLGLALPAALAFGALIAPTDPISVIALLKQVGVSLRLRVLVEGESLLNDGVAAVLFSLVVAAVMSGQNPSLTGALGSFAAVALGGLAVGALAGVLGALITHAFDEAEAEIMITVAVAYGAYLGAEALHVSGVLAVVASGVMVGNLAMPKGMTPTSRVAVGAFWGFAAYAANSVVFLLVGLEATHLNWLAQPSLILGGILAAFVGRVVAIYGLSPLLRLGGAHLPGAWQHLLVWGGLRGALSMALALGLPPNFPGRDWVVAMTFGAVMSSLLVQGLSADRAVRWLGLMPTKGGLADYERLTGQALAWRAALHAVEGASAHGGLAAPAAASAKAAFAERLGEAEAELQRLHLDDESLARSQAEAAIRLGLAAAEEAVRHAAARGVVDHDVATEVGRGIASWQESLDAEAHEADERS